MLHWYLTRSNENFRRLLYDARHPIMLRAAMFGILPPADITGWIAAGWRTDRPSDQCGRPRNAIVDQEDSS